jgi:hypothetical protein
LSAGVYRKLGQPSAYVHTRGFEPEQMEQMILQYVRAHHGITRRDVTELCRVSERQATYLLHKLVASGRLDRQGTGRGTTYVLPKTNKMDKKTNIVRFQVLTCASLIATSTPSVLLEGRLTVLNLYWKSNGETRTLLETPFSSEMEFEKYIFENQDILGDIYIIFRQVRTGGKQGIPDMLGIDAYRSVSGRR